MKRDAGAGTDYRGALRDGGTPYLDESLICKSLNHFPSPARACNPEERKAMLKRFRRGGNACFGCHCYSQLWSANSQDRRRGLGRIKIKESTFRRDASPASHVETRRSHQAEKQVTVSTATLETNCRAEDKVGFCAAPGRRLCAGNSLRLGLSEVRVALWS